jgi:hypothetical protein
MIVRDLADGGDDPDQDGHDDRDEQAEAAKDEAGYGESLSLPQVRLISDLAESDERKDEAENIERQSVAAQSKRQRYDAEDHACDGKRMCLTLAGARWRCNGKSNAKFRESGQWLPPNASFVADPCFCGNASLLDPLSQLFGGYRAVLPAVAADDPVHAELLLDSLSPVKFRGSRGCDLK